MGIENSAGNSSYQVNAAVVEEMVLNTSGMSAEVNSDGPVMNIVPKEGGNTFRFIASGAVHQRHAGERQPRRRASGLAACDPPNRTNKIFDNAVSVGGPIKRDKIWFFGAARTWGMARQFAGLYWNKGQNTLLSPPGADLEVVKYDPWIDRPFDVAQRPVGMVRLVPRPRDLAAARRGTSSTSSWTTSMPATAAARRRTS